ncbi:hypothetical protein BDV96DRAFT_640379 [Lophiotrema nucula]|uniref:FAD-binding domain-containing protein n=1 Tax=Lophiotrema nucula TaxID=690887 RepID=A0A6A5ZVP1_9PLEO|nr:hypothetical protein BDV96DRAFT_640379 [Lophiotrema nucula]
MGGLILNELKKCPSVEVKFGLRYVGIDDDPKKDFVRVMCHTKKPPDDDVSYEGSYVVGTDGANSSVRRLSCIPFDCYTFSEFKMIGTNILFDFEKRMGYTPINFFVDPDEWGVVAHTSEHGDGIEKDGEEKIPQWRSEVAHSKSMKGRIDFKIIRAEAYWIHQRCAAKARKGKIMLAGDALHSNNPIGDLGLTGGILDAFVVGNALTRVVKGGESDSLLTDCANSRRDAWLNTTSKLAMSNMTRLGNFGDNEAKIRDEFFSRLNTDPEFPKIVRSGLDKMIPETFEKPVAVA